MTEQAIPYSEDDLHSTDVAKGFESFALLSDIMQRYPFDLKATHGGRIFTDATNNTKLRRKPIKGNNLQNYMFEVYQTRDGNHVPLQQVEISSAGFTPAMLIAAVAAKVAADGPSKYNRFAILMLQGAAALLAEGEKARKILNDKLNPEKDPVKNQFYFNQQGIHARAYGLNIVKDIIANLIKDDASKDSFAKELAFSQTITDEKYGEGARAESMADKNLLFAALTSFLYSPAVQDVIVMGDEIKQSIGEAALAELDDNEQK